MNNIKNLLLGAAAISMMALSAVSCSDEKDEPDTGGSGSSGTGSSVETPSVEPDFNSTIEPFDTLTRATDSYTPGDDNDIYWQANNWGCDITVTYDGKDATVSSNVSNGVKTYVSGGHVAINVTADVKTRITVSGTTSDGSIKIYSDSKTLVVLDNADITSTTGPAINCQSKKRLFIEVPDSCVATLTDAAIYSNDSYYQPGASSLTEDRKGAVFAEGNVIVSGKGLLQINANYRHGLATDGMLRILPGTTLAVNSAGKNGLHAKGSSKEQAGIIVEGGYIYTLCTGDAGKCLKSDMDINILAGTLSLNNSAEAIFDTEDNSASSGAGIKSDANVNITGGDVYIKLTGDGSKGISAEGSVNLSAASVTVTSTGRQFTHSVDSSSPAGLKADGDITISGGEVNVAMYADDSEADAVKASGSVSITDGELYCYAYGKGISGTEAVKISGGKVYSLSRQNEAITSKSSIAITGGLVLSHSPKSLAAAGSSILTVNNATVIAAGGRTMTTVDSNSPTAKTFSSVNISAYEPFAVASASGTALFAMQFLPDCEDMPLLVASPKFTSGTSWTLAVGGEISASSSDWNGYRSGASVSSPTSETSFSF